jgi:hypothetical protein
VSAGTAEQRNWSNQVDYIDVAIAERQMRQATMPPCTVRTDSKKQAHYRKETWNVAGMPRKYSRAYRKVRAMVLVRDGFSCVPGALGMCPFCSGQPLPESSLQTDHIIAWVANGPASFAYTYAAPTWDAATGDWYRTGNRLHVFIDSIVADGEMVLRALYGEHAAVIMDSEYDAECDAFNLLTTCTAWNAAAGDAPKGYERYLIEEVVRRQNGRPAAFSGLHTYDQIRSVATVLNRHAMTAYQIANRAAPAAH